MVVNQKSIDALKNPETIAKSIATRQRNKENRLALKQKIAYEKLEKSSDGLLSQIRNQIGDDTNTATKLANLEYSSKTQEGRLDNIKNQVDINTQAISTLSKISPVLHNIGSHQQNNTPVRDEECREKLKKLKNNMDDNTKSINKALEDLSEEIEQNDTEIADLYTRVSNMSNRGNSKELRELTDKVNILFKILYQSVPKIEYMNSLCPVYNTEPTLPEPPPPLRQESGFFATGRRQR